MTHCSHMPGVLVVSLAGVLASCAQSSPPDAIHAWVGEPGIDLVPVAVVRNQEENTYKQYCDLHGDVLFIHIANNGREDAPRTAFHVAFALQSGKVEYKVSLPGIGSGHIATFPVGIPPFCYKPDCSFRIRVDPANDVAESNEYNNLAFGLCEK